MNDLNLFPEPMESGFATVESALPSARRQDLEMKQVRVAQMLGEVGCEAALVLRPENVRWFCGEDLSSGLTSVHESPALYLTPVSRTIVCSTLDAERIFREKVDRLGFLLKVYPWFGKRALFLHDLIAGKKVAADLPTREAQDLGGFFDRERPRLSTYGREQALETGRLLTHAIEATCRSIRPGETEQEIAGRLAYRLIRHGVEAHGLQVTADDHGADSPRAGCTDRPITRSAIVQATGSMHGIFLTACRTVVIGAPDPALLKAYDFAGRTIAVQLAAAIGDRRMGAVAHLGRRALRNTEYEHSWRDAPPCLKLGRVASDGPVNPLSEETLEFGQAYLWQGRIGAAALGDSYLFGERGWELLTRPQEWPARRLTIGAERVILPETLRIDADPEGLHG